MRQQRGEDIVVLAAAVDLGEQAALAVVVEQGRGVAGASQERWSAAT